MARARRGARVSKSAGFGAGPSVAGAAPSAEARLAPTAAISAAVDGPDDTGVIGDLTGDGLVDVQDLLSLLSAWGRCPAPCPPSCSGDLNGDCQVDTADLLQMLANWS